MKRYGLYWLRALTLGAGLNTLIVSQIMAATGASFLQAVPFGTFVSVNCSFAADRIIFGSKNKKRKVVSEPCSIHTPHSCPGCSEQPCVCDSWDTDPIEDHRAA